MISTKKLIRLARKWQKFVAVRRNRVSYRKVDEDADSFSTLSTSKGHFVVYTSDGRRFMLPLRFLNHEIVRELFRLAEDEFGLPNNGPLTLPCEASFMEYAIALIQHDITEDIQKALLIFIPNCRCSSSSTARQGEIKQKMICGF